MSLENNDLKVEVLRLRTHGLSQEEISKKVGVSKSAIGKFLNKKSFKEWWALNEKPIASGKIDNHHHKVRTFKDKCFILTSAQNNTYVHDKFLASLEVFAKRIGARIIVGTFSYNKSGFQNLQKSEAEWFDPKIQDYILDEPAYLAKGLMWCGELNILPTAVDPLSGFHSYSKSNSAIIPHAKVQMESLPVFKHQDPKFLYTTGAVTLRNYIQKKAGQKAAFHHIFGALVVEVDKDGDWFVRQISADKTSGEFYDLDTLYTPDGFTTGHRIEAVTWGDIHAEKRSDAVYGCSFEKTDSILDTLKPKFQFVNDVLDFESRNHHNIKDPYFRFKRHITNLDYVEDDIHCVADALHQMQREWCQTVVVESNHDLALKKWLSTADYKDDPANAIFFLECQLEMYKAIRMGNYDFSIFEHVIKSKFKKLQDVRFLKTDESFVICCDEDGEGIENGQHGHIGINGGKGSIQAYRKLASKVNLGHSHSAGIRDGVFQSGVSGDISLFSYATGPSTWSNSHIITYQNGKRSIITIKNGKWRK